MQYPMDELLFWAASFSIDDNGDKPTITPQQNHVTVKQSIEDLKRVLAQ